MSAIIAQAGAVVVRLDRSEPEYLLVTARRNPDNWIFPKGHIEPGESAEDAAIREAEEEAGVLGRAVGLAGRAAFARDDLDYEVSYFVVVTEEEGVAREGRQRAWLRYEAAAARVAFDEVRDVLEAAHRLITGLATG